MNYPIPQIMINLIHDPNGQEAKVYSVSSLPSMFSHITVPTLIGSTLTEALNILTEYGFQITASIITASLTICATYMGDQFPYEMDI